MASSSFAPRLGSSALRLRPGWMQDNGVYAALVVLLLANAAFTDRFVTVSNLRTQLIQVVPVVIVALGMALVIGTEGIDLSVGSVMALASALLPQYLGYGWPVALVVCILGGVAVGLVNGWLVASIGLQPIVATLASLIAVRGLANIVLDNQADIHDRTLLDLGSGSVLGIPYTVLVAAVLALVVAFLVRRTLVGRRIVSIGGNRAASELAGLPVKRTLLLVYVISGSLAAVAGVLATARLTASTPNTLGNLVELSAITAVVVGGTPLSGGKVKILGTVAGALLMQLIRSTLIAHDLKDSAAQMVQAAIIIVAVYSQRRRGAR
ncbi:monosaccharide ABC transporter membrane protein (CUT2 family) [Motilibacter rhizosphaerae]|uniref:Monosaccharide ABC transporter membrane protein (CUT2 family) n=1 Tax=Motilibacter rhizosphaerae TaxID=598652 RepID=A0A4V2F4N7_9ACTN|nr:ABC transporter permease [Motilibacter rhizosphaerae]RZS89959.1 monosaccharide ABC transporter membrane protein (CUT2 family) [Motilibacter rhizosphaerae]